MWLSRNYRFADKQERTEGRSKVVRKFLCRNFLPRGVKRDTCSRFCEFAQQILFDARCRADWLKLQEHGFFTIMLSLRGELKCKKPILSGQNRISRLPKEGIPFDH